MIDEEYIECLELNSHPCPQSSSKQDIHDDCIVSGYNYSVGSRNFLVQNIATSGQQITGVSIKLSVIMNMKNEGRTWPITG